MSQKEVRHTPHKVIVGWMVFDKDGLVMNDFMRLAIYDDERSAREFAEWTFGDDEEYSIVPCAITHKEASCSKG